MKITHKKGNKIPPEKKFVFNVNYRGTVDSEMTVTAETKEEARKILEDFYPGATIEFLRELTETPRAF